MHTDKKDVNQRKKINIAKRKSAYISLNQRSSAFKKESAFKEISGFDPAFHERPTENTHADCKNHRSQNKSPSEIFMLKKPN